MSTTIAPIRSVGIRELGTRLDRQPATIRMWEREALLPAELRATRDSRNRRVWTAEQADGIERWMHETKRFPGSGLRGYDPSPERLDQHLGRMRKTRNRAAA